MRVQWAVRSRTGARLILLLFPAYAAIYHSYPPLEMAIPRYSSETQSHLLQAGDHDSCI